MLLLICANVPHYQLVCIIGLFVADYIYNEQGHTNTWGLVFDLTLALSPLLELVR